MATLEELNDNWSKLDIDQLAMTTIKENDETMLALNKKQLKEGFDRDGKRLREYKSSLYAEVKNRMNPLPGFGNPDLFKTGDFYNEFTLRVVGKKQFTMYSQDAKYQKLVKDYGEGIFGLNTSKKIELIDGGFLESMQKNLRKTVKLE